MQPSREELNNQLFAAAATNNTHAIWKLICAGADVNARNEVGNTPIMLLKIADWPFNPGKTINVCIDAGARFDLCNNEGNSALLFAAKEGDEDKCKLIIFAQSKRNRKIIPALLLLNRLKNEGNWGAHLLYRQFKTLLLPYLGSVKSPVLSLDDLKSMKNNEGKRACDYLPLYSLVPKSELKTLSARILYRCKHISSHFKSDMRLALCVGVATVASVLSAYYICKPGNPDICQSETREVLKGLYAIWAVLIFPGLSMLTAILWK